MIAGCLFYLVSTLLVVLLSDNFRLSASDAGALFILGCMTATALNTVLDTNQGCVVMDLTQPLSLYVLLFSVYYILPVWASILSSSPARPNGLAISGLVACAFLSLYFGFRWGLRHAQFQNILSLSERGARILLVFCYCSAFLVLWYYAWHISIGVFYTHTGVYEPDTTLFAGLMENFVARLQLPVILLLGLIMRGAAGAPAQQAKRFLLVYVTGLVLVYSASSQFRPAATALLFMTIALNMSRKTPIRLRYQVLTGILVVLLLFVIQGARLFLSPDDSFGLKNQLSEASSHSVGGMSSAVQQKTLRRLINQPLFLSEIMDAVHHGYGYLYGAPLVESAFAVVPRALWPGKPIVIPMQLLLKVSFGLPVLDDAPGALLEFYANGSWLGVALGFLAVSFMVGRFTRWAARKQSVFLWLLLCWWWADFANVESELLVELLVSARVVIIVFIAYWLLTRLLPQAHPSPAVGL